MKTKLLALLLVLVMAVGMLAACGGGTEPCTEHVDADKNGICDNEGCGASVAIPPCEHADKNGDLKCDECGKNMACPNHVDLDGDGLCNTCGERYDIWDEVAVEWSTTPLIFKLTENTNTQQLPSTCHRYMAGDDSQYKESIDTKVKQRNDAAYAKTKVSVTYDYFTDDAKYGWGKCTEEICTKIESGASDTPDMYCNFVYDMVAASLKGAFANLYSTSRGTDALAGKNYFQFLNPDYVDSGSGYMVEYMKSLSLSKTKMYCLSSDYFTDMVRAFFVVPVNIKLINSIEVDLTKDNAFNSDRTGDGKFTIDDFYALVNAGQWNYTTLAQFASAIAQDSGEDTSTETLDDTVGFAISSSSGLSSSGMIYTTSVTIINRDWSDEIQDYIYAYPDPTTEEGAADIADLVKLCDNLTVLFSQPGIISVNSSHPTVTKYSVEQDSLLAIRTCFTENRVLFGGVICLGSLEYDAYQEMKDSKDGGFGVAPAPLYRDVNPLTNQPDKYLTQIHNVGRIGAIAKSTLKFAQCTAFLDYMSTHSTQILNEYYDYKLKYDIAGGTNGNAEMLEYIRYNVRSSFDKAYEDAIGKYFLAVDENSNNNKWHEMVRQAEYKLTDMNTRYAEVYGQKAAQLQKLWEDFPSLPE